MNPVLALAFACQAECLSIDLKTQSVETLGSILTTSEVSTVEAYKLMKRECLDRAEDAGLGRGANVTLAKDYSYFQRESSGSEHWSTWDGPYPSRFSYSRFWVRRGHSSYYFDRDFRLDVWTASPFDKTVCSRFKQNPKGRPVYTGPGRPLG